MRATPLSPGQALRMHWPEYLIEAWGLGTVMLAAAAFATLLEYPGSPVHQALPRPFPRHALMGAGMGLVVTAVIYSPWGKRSGAHLNPAVTLTFLLLRKIRPSDAAFYVLSQFAGGAFGVLLGRTLIGSPFATPPVSFANTVAGPAGQGAAYLAEFGMSFGLMLAILWALASERRMDYAGLAAGALLALFITLFVPLSGVSLNPARTFASALPAAAWDELWIFFTAPVIGMLGAAHAYRWRWRGGRDVCAKLNHDPAYPCIHCGHRPETGDFMNGENSHVQRTL